MKIVQNNAYWRELLENNPHLLLVFKIDDEEKAELVFANKHVETVLGFRAEEFVLKSVQDNEIALSLESLIDRVAQHSRKEITQQDCQIDLPTKAGGKVLLNFVYDGYRIKSSQNFHISILLSSNEISQNLSSPLTTKFEAKNEFIAESMVMKALIERIPSIVETQQVIVIQGEPKTGKSTLAEYIIGQQYYADFIIKKGNKSLNDVQINAVGNKLLIVLDEIHTLDSSNQTKLLGLVEFSKKNHVDLKIVATTTVGLDKLLDNGKFLPELYYQLVAYTLHVPPLRFRKEDVEYYLNQKKELIRRLLNKSEITFNDECAEFLKTAQWPNNFESLQEFVEEMLSYVEENEISLPDLYNKYEPGQSNLFTEDEGSFTTLEEVQRKYLIEVLTRTGGKIYGRGGAARVVGLKPTTLQSKLKRLGIKR